MTHGGGAVVQPVLRPLVTTPATCQGGGSIFYLTNNGSFTLSAPYTNSVRAFAKATGYTNSASSTSALFAVVGGVANQAPSVEAGEDQIIGWGPVADRGWE
jgi:hypothetical protein